MGKDRRRYARAEIHLDVTLDSAGREWPGKTVNLSPFGAKVATLAKSLDLPVGTKVELRFPPQDQEPPLRLPGSVRRTDPDGVALSFAPLEDPDFQRIKRLVDAFQQNEWEEVLTQLGDGPARDAGAGVPGRSVMPREESLETAPAEGLELERLQAVLSRVGLAGLQLPREGILTPQWREFLRRLEAQESPGEQKRTAPRR